MIARPTWFWSSLFSSLTVNAVLFVSGVCYLYSKTPIWEPGWPEGSVVMPDDNFALIVPAVADTTLGDPTGKGTATDSEIGEQPMEARQAEQDQPWFSRDPQGFGRAKGAGEASQSKLSLDDQEQATPAQFGVATANPASATPRFAKAQPATPTPAAPQPSAPPPPQSNLIAQSNEVQKQSDIAPATQPTVDLHAAVASVTQPNAQDATKQTDTKAQANNAVQPQQQQQSQQQQKPSQQANASASTSAGKAGQPAPQSESDSDPFTIKGVAKFSHGKTEVQFGRKHKIVQPRLGLAGQTALLQLHSPVIVVLSLSLDENGNVTHVGVLQSSGSTDIDHACTVAAYKWWLEPSKDKDGKPIKDVIPFVIGFS